MIKLHIFNGWWNLQHVIMYTITVVIIIHTFLVSQYIYIYIYTHAQAYTLPANCLSLQKQLSIKYITLMQEMSQHFLLLSLFCWERAL